jgi:hypothetical protein
MIITHEYPFNCAIHHFLRVFISDLQLFFKILSRNIVRLNCINIYKEKMSSSYELFDKLDCRFSFTSDLWTNKDKDGFDGSYISLY